MLAILAVTLSPLALASAPNTSSNAERFWPQWRGPHMTGVAPAATPPIEWSEAKNVRWKVEIPGKGSATPVVWGDRIFVLTAIPTGEARPVPESAAPQRPSGPPPGAAQAPASPGTAPGAPPAPGTAAAPGAPPGAPAAAPAPAAPAAAPAAPAAPAQAAQPAPPGAPPGAPRPGGGPPRNILPEHVQQFAILAINRADGKVLWKRVLREEQPHEGTHPTATWASSSAATDGEIVLAFFGSRGLYALDMNGQPLWEKDLGDMKVKLGFGEGSTPALARDRVIVQWDDEKESFLVALDKKTGKELWRQKREEATSWASPLVVEHGGKTQIVTSATNKVRAYDAAAGELLWETPGMTQNAIPTPVHKDGLVILTSGFRGNALLAVKLAEAKGDISASPAIAWKLDRDTPYVPSPLLYGDLLYLLKSNNGVLTCLDAKTGERIYGPERIEAVPNVYASPIGAGGRVYVAGREGTTAVLEAGRSFKVLATNTLEDGFDASPVAVDKELYLRGRKYLYRISE
jgi:outer membrane protein assembly factor BamB